MRWLDVLYVAAITLCAALAALHVLIWMRDRSARANLAFASLAISVIGIALVEMAMMWAPTPEAFGTIERWFHVPLFATVVFIVAFVHLYFGGGRLWLGHAAWITRLLSLVVNFAQSPNVTHSEITGVQHVVILGQTVSVAVGTMNPWGWLPRVSILLLLAYIADSAIASWRNGTRVGRRRAVTVGGTLFAFLFISVTYGFFVIAGIVSTPYLLALYFLGAVAAMGWELSWDVVRAGELGRQLQQSQAELKETQSRLVQVVDAAIDAIVTVDQSRRIVQFNRAAEAMLGCSAPDVLGQSFDQFVPEPSRGGYRAHFEGHAESGRPSRTVISPGLLNAARSNGEVFPVEASFSRVGNDGGDLVTLILRDRTEQREMQAEARLMREEVAHLSRVGLMNELSGSLAHELNQPLGAILSKAQALRRLLAREDSSTEEISEVVDDIIADDKRAGEVVHRLRTFLRRGQPDLEAVDLSDLVENTLRLLQGELVDRGVTLRTELGDARVVVMGGRVELRQVLLNLLVNAYEAMATTPPGRRILSVRVERRSEGMVHLSVSDSGRGIPREALDDIFQPFFTTKSQGMGMGLAICRTIVTAHGGRLWAENDPGSGATFLLTLPTEQ